MDKKPNIGDSLYHVDFGRCVVAKEEVLNRRSAWVYVVLEGDSQIRSVKLSDLYESCVVCFGEGECDVCSGKGIYDKEEIYTK